MRMSSKAGPWNPTRITAISFLAMTLIVVVIGFLGTRHIVQYLEQQVIKHGIEHNKTILDGVVPALTGRLKENVPRTQFIRDFQHQADQGQAFGVHIFLVDGLTGSVVAGDLPVPYTGLPKGDLTVLPMHEVDGSPITNPTEWEGPAWVETPAGLIELLHLRPLSSVSGDKNRWTVGVVTDLGQLSSFLHDLHWHLDTVLLVTYGLIALLGFLALRRFGRLYERKLEKSVTQRTNELKRAHQEILDKTRLATIGQTASVLAHEMRNPLASLKFALSGISTSECLQGHEKKRVNLVLGEVNRLEQMLSDTLDYVRPIRRSDDPTALDELLDRVLQLEEPVLAQKKLRVERTRCAQCPLLQLDRDQMQQVLLNLLKNAIEANPMGGEIGISTSRCREKVLLKISNQGEPIPEETLEKAFVPFFTTKSKGTGLGLGLVKRVIEEHDGKVTITSDMVNGTVVRLSLPTGI